MFLTSRLQLQYHEMAIRCTCAMFIRVKGLCAHTLAVADHVGFLPQYLETVEKSAPKALNEMLNNKPANAGLKPKEKKKRKGKNNKLSTPVENEYEENDLDFPKPCEYTEYFHNDERFFITKLGSSDCTRAKECISCTVAFPKLNKPSIRQELIVYHRERYQRPIYDEDKKFLRMTITKQLGKKFYCLKKSCLRKRHPYFWKGLIKCEDKIKKELTDDHKLIIKEELNLDL